MTLQSLPAIDIRACVFAIAPQAQSINNNLFNEITDRITATYTLCLESLDVTAHLADINWASVSKQGVQVLLHAATDMIPLFIPWTALENESSMLAYASQVTSTAQNLEMVA